MIGRTTSQGIKEALAAARLGETKTTTPLAAELESLVHSLAGDTGDTSSEAQGEEPNKALQQTLPTVLPGSTPHPADC